jgi:hypothetical protein
MNESDEQLKVDSQITNSTDNQTKKESGLFGLNRIQYYSRMIFANILFILIFIGIIKYLFKDKGLEALAWLLISFFIFLGLVVILNIIFIIIYEVKNKKNKEYRLMIFLHFIYLFFIFIGSFRLAFAYLIFILISTIIFTNIYNSQSISK